VKGELDVELPRERPELRKLEVVVRDPRGQAVQDVPLLDLLGEGRDQGLLPVLPPTELYDELAGDFPHGPPDVLVRRIALVHVHPDELDLHRGEPEVVHVLDAVPQRPTLAG